MAGRDIPEQARRRAAAAARRVLRGYSMVGIALSVILGAAAYVFAGNSAERVVCGTGATAALFGSAASLNMSDRLWRGKPVYATFFSGLAAALAIALVGVSFMAIERDFWGAWSPLLASGFLFVLALISWRLTR